MINRETFTFVRLLLAVLLVGFSMFFLPILEPIFLGVVYSTTASFELGRDVFADTHAPGNPYGWSGLGAAYQMILDRGYDGHLTSYGKFLFWATAAATVIWEWSAVILVILFFGGIIAGFAA
jgi:hypothetical protein